jgi:hypothetical protein
MSGNLHLDKSVALFIKERILPDIIDMNNVQLIQIAVRLMQYLEGIREINGPDRKRVLLQCLDMILQYLRQSGRISEGVYGDLNNFRVGVVPFMVDVIVSASKGEFDLNHVKTCCFGLLNFCVRTPPQASLEEVFSSRDLADFLQIKSGGSAEGGSAASAALLPTVPAAITIDPLEFTSEAKGGVSETRPAVEPVVETAVLEQPTVGTPGMSSPPPPPPPPLEDSPK